MKIRSLVALSMLVITAGVVLALKAHNGGGGFGAAFGGSLAGSYVGTSVANSSGGCECNCRSLQRQIDNLQKQLDKCRGNN